jgi:sugar transferase EpsL
LTILSSFYRSHGKRWLDLALATPALIAAAPVMGVVAAAIRLSMGSPVVYRQSRPGKDLRPFDIVKFRTMRAVRLGETEALSDAARLTPVGRFLRKTSLDELPELLNVLRGEMSLVGPRPLLFRYVAYFTEEEMARQTVTPGMTGWAQVNGRNQATWDERLACDVWYVKNASLVLDLRILLRTVVAVFPGSHVVSDARSIMLNLDEERARRGVR